LPTTTTVTEIVKKWDSVSGQSPAKVSVTSAHPTVKKKDKNKVWWSWETTGAMINILQGHVNHSAC